MLDENINYTAGAISEAYEVAIEGLSQFVGTYKSNIHALNGALSTALTKTFVELGTLAANGQSINGTKILQKFAVNAGVKALPLWGQGWVGDEAMTTPSNDNRRHSVAKRNPVPPSNDNRPMQLLQSVA